MNISIHHGTELYEEDRTGIGWHFQSQQALDQHLKTSTQHRSLAQPSRNKSSTDLSQLRKIKLKPTHLPQLPTVIPTSRHTIPQVFTPESVEIPEQRDKRWSVISAAQQLEVLESLSWRCHSPESLLQNSYRIYQYTAEELASLRKCKNCGVAQRKASFICRFHRGTAGTKQRQVGPKIYSCCGMASKGCISLSTHYYANLDPQVAVRYQSYAYTPPASPSKPKFQAVVLDCEMAHVKGGGAEVIFLSAVDFITGAVLLNHYVRPERIILDWSTRIHGITRFEVDAAAARGEALLGWNGAREALWRLIDESTILVGHALRNDLDVLRLIHPRIVDSAILTREAVGEARQWGLDTLCRELLHIKFRDNKKSTHDCMEDVLATRDVVLWCIQHEDELQKWAQIKRSEEERKREERKRLQEAKKAAEEKMRSLGTGLGGRSFSSTSETDETLHWSDIAEDLGWPHPDTGYDPWSD
ncbi:hypothetical protein B7463_g856, partial [Scytalidium lignicola]